MLEYGYKYRRFIFDNIYNEDGTALFSYQVMYPLSEENWDKMNYLSDFIFEPCQYPLEEFLKRCKLFEEACEKEGIELLHYTPNYIICKPDNDIIQGEPIEEIYEVVA